MPPFRNCTAEAVLGAYEVAAHDQAARDLEVRRRRTLDRVERHVVRGLRLFMPPELGEHADEHRHRGLARGIDAKRRLEGGNRIGLPIHLREQQALRQARVARGGQQRRRLAVLLERFVVSPGRLEDPAKLQHPVAARRIARKRGAKLALGFLEPALAEHLASAVRVLFAFAGFGHRLLPWIKP